MSEINAFVGHSFTPEDAEVVGKFTKYFDKFSRLLPGFSWISAEAAEPKVLSEKVLSLIQGRNVFIAVCTKKERVAKPVALSKVPLLPSYNMVKEEGLEWKTSDWIIQEVGLAAGLRLQLILLLEEEVREPGGIQGDVEYIRFAREAPEKCFTKILEMVAALSPRPSVGQATSSEARSSTATEEGPAESSSGIEWLSPQPGWQRDDYDNALVYIVLRDDNMGLKNLESDYFATEHGQQEENIASWDSQKESLRIIFGRGGDLSKLRNLAKKHPDNARVLADLAHAVAEYDSRQAASDYESAAEKVLDIEDKQRLLRSAAENYARAKEWDKAWEIVEALKAQSPADERQLLRSLQTLADLQKDKDASIAILERTVQITPDDLDARFSPISINSSTTQKCPCSTTSKFRRKLEAR